MFMFVLKVRRLSSKLGFLLKNIIGFHDIRLNVTLCLMSSVAYLIVLNNCQEIREQLHLKRRVPTAEHLQF